MDQVFRLTGLSTDSRQQEPRSVCSGDFTMMAPVLIGY